jgi:hypothetical protein
MEEKDRSILDIVGNITKAQAEEAVDKAEEALEKAQDDLRQKRAVLRFFETLENGNGNGNADTTDTSFDVKTEIINELLKNDTPIRGVDELIRKAVVSVKDGKETPIDADGVKKLSRGEKRQIIRKIKKYCKYSNDDENENARIIYITEIKKELSYKERLDSIKNIDVNELDNLISIEKKLKELAEIRK